MRCPRCNSENPPEYRFCGMCGTPLDRSLEGSLRASEPAGEHLRKSEAQESLSGPSFLGLSGPSRGSEDVTYLFEEEQPRRSYWRFILLLLILGIVGSLGWLEYNRSGKAWVAPWAHQQPTTPEQASQQPPQPPVSPPAPATAAPQPQPPAANSAGNRPTAAQNTPASPPPPKETDLAPGATSSAATNPVENAATRTPTPPTTEQPATNTETAKKESEATPAKGKAEENESASDESDANEVQRATKPKPQHAKPAPVSANPDDALVSNAEKYLYGRGVPQNCDRALLALRAAADRQNARAQGLLGTMYGTGHCVSKDLPNAYRWFALASRQQSDNMWIQRNLEMIWREMTPQERQLAMQANR